MRKRIALTLAAAAFLTVGASAQDWRYRDRDDRMFFNEGYNRGYRCAVSGRDCNNDFRTSRMSPDDRRAFNHGFREGAEHARRDNGWRR